MKDFGKRMLLLVFFALLASGCNDDNPANGGGGTTITPDGGTVTGPDGVILVVPPGAVDENVEISITSYLSTESLPIASIPFVSFLGGADFGPDNYIFNLPVTITLPSSEHLTPGDSVPIYYYDELESGWRCGEFLAAVDPDGYSITGQVTHFSLFGNFGGGVFGNFGADFGNGANADVAFNSFIQWFHANICHVGKRGTYENECEEAMGIHFDLGYQVNILPDGPVYEGSPYIAEGEQTDHQVSFTERVDYTVDGEIDLYYNLSVDVFLECKQPNLGVTASPGNIEIGETSTVTATLTCGDDAMQGKEVTFEAAGGLGILSVSSATTSGAGQAQTVFTASAEGRESIITESVACDGSETATASPTIDIGSSWTGTINMNFNHDTGGAGYIFNDNVSISFNLEFDSTEISGSGSGTHSMTVTPTEDCWIEAESAPSFTAYVSGTRSDNNIEFQIIPNTNTVSFNLVCPNGDNPPIVTPILIYTYLEASIMGQYMIINMPLENGATANDSGTEGDPPLNWSYQVTIQQN